MSPNRKMTEEEIQDLLGRVKVQVDPDFNHSLQEKLRVRARELQDPSTIPTPIEYPLRGNNHSRPASIRSSKQSLARPGKGSIFSRFSTMGLLSSAVVTITVLVFVITVILPLFNKEPFVSTEPTEGITATPGASARKTQIIFVSDQSGSSEIYAANPDGTNVIQLTHNAAEIRSPEWSPDGSHIAFLAAQNGAWGLYIINADGSNQARVTDVSGNAITLEWSPDSEHIAFTMAPAIGPVSLYIVGLGDDTPTLVSEASVGDFDWAPDGTSLAFVGSYEDMPAVLSYEISTGVLTPLTREVADSTRLSWRPDGTQIAFTSPASNGMLISLLNMDGLSTTPINAQPLNITMLQWSPQGSYLAYYVWNDAAAEPQADIYVTDAQGNQPIHVATAIAPMGFDWSPDEKQIVFKSTDDNNQGIIEVVNRDGTGLHTISIPGTHSILPSWSPLIAAIPADTETLTATDAENQIENALSTEPSPTDTVTPIPSELPTLLPTPIPTRLPTLPSTWTPTTIFTLPPTWTPTAVPPPMSTPTMPSTPTPMATPIPTTPPPPSVEVTCSWTRVSGYIQMTAPYVRVTVSTSSFPITEIGSAVGPVQSDGSYTVTVTYAAQPAGTHLIGGYGEWDGSWWLRPATTFGADCAGG
jgi:Tol biopolymer transport system component